MLSLNVRHKIRAASGVGSKYRQLSESDQCRNTCVFGRSGMLKPEKQFQKRDMQVNHGAPQVVNR